MDWRFTEVVAEARAVLKPGGRLALEFSRRTMPGVLALLEKEGFTRWKFRSLVKEPRLVTAVA
jgi:methylase of polypeptide subunit release factors